MNIALRDFDKDLIKCTEYKQQLVWATLAQENGVFPSIILLIIASIMASLNTMMGNWNRSVLWKPQCKAQNKTAWWEAGNCRSGHQMLIRKGLGRVPNRELLLISICLSKSWIPWESLTDLEASSFIATNTVGNTKPVTRYDGWDVPEVQSWELCQDPGDN